MAFPALFSLSASPSPALLHLSSGGRSVSIAANYYHSHPKAGAAAASSSTSSSANDHQLSAGADGSHSALLQSSSPNGSVYSIHPPRAAATSAAAASVAASFNYTAFAEGALHQRTASLAVPAVEESPPQHLGYDVEKMQQWIHTIKEMFRSMTLGEITTSAYDTAWVAMVPTLENSATPQFPQCLEWITENQHADGSWGDKDMFLAYDRVCNTLACVVALKTWDVGHESIKRGLQFLRDNIATMELEADDYMPIGFEVVVPALLDDAKDLDLDLPYNSPTILRIRSEREKKLQRIPMEVLHTHPTTLLHSLEGLHKIVDWNRLLKLQSKDGSFLFSPASTACALRYTRDEKCLQYLELVLKKFDNAVPNVYPVDLFEHLWMVDRLERLGISHYFKNEIKVCLDYVYRYWTDRGIAWARESDVYDVDDTAMGFRLLRLHGYDVSPDVFDRFKEGGQFFCFEGQTSQAITGMYNLYRASHIAKPGETILQETRAFTRSFLQTKRDAHQLHDKWIISKDLQGEVEYALHHPWYASLPRLETREYIDQYGVDDVWIGKSLYRMPNVNNETFLSLAKADYNLCQEIHQKELTTLKRWYKESCFDKLAFARQKLVECYFSGAATMFEPEMAAARLVWARCSVLTSLLDDFFDTHTSLPDLTDFLLAIKSWDPMLTRDFSPNAKALFMGLYNTLNTINQEAFVAQGRDISSHLRKFWVKWITTIWIESVWRFTHYVPSRSEYMEVAMPSIALEPIVQSTLFFVGERLSDDVILHADYDYIMDLVNIIGRLNNDIRGYQRETEEGKLSSVNAYLKENPKGTEEEAIAHFEDIIDQNMAMLVQEYLRDSKVPRPCKYVHLNIARIMNFFYHKVDGYTSLTEMKNHVKNLLYTPTI